jgi:hypothetical protein
MKPRNLTIAAVVLAVLCGAVWYAQKHPPASSSSATGATPKLLDIPEREVQSIEVKKKDGSTLTLARQHGNWEITSPAQYKADQDSASGVASSLSPVSADSVVEDKPADVSKYGLKAPSLSVTIHRTNGKSDEIFFGDDVPAGSLVYARVDNDPKVYAVSSSVKSSLDKSVNDLRDKRLLTFDSNKLSRIELISGKSDTEFGKNAQGDWQIIKPQPYRADSFQVEELVRKLGDAKMDLSGSPDDAKKAAAAYASGQPAATVKVTDASGTQTLEVRKNKDDFYAKSSVVTGVYKIPSDVGKALEKTTDDFRNKKVFDFGFSDPTKIELHGSTGDKVLTRSGTDWKSNGATMDAGTVQSFIDKARDLTADKFASGGFTQPEFAITIVSNDGKRTERVEFAKASDGYLARRENEPTLYHLDSKAVNDILAASKGIKPASSAGNKK